MDARSGKAFAHAALAASQRAGLFQHGDGAGQCRWLDARLAQSVAKVLAEQRHSVSQRLRQWGKQAKANKGEQRQEGAVSAWFAPLLAWLLSLWDPTHQHLVWGREATLTSIGF